MIATSLGFHKTLGIMTPCHRDPAQGGNRIFVRLDNVRQDVIQGACSHRLTVRTPSEPCCLISVMTTRWGGEARSRQCFLNIYSALILRVRSVYLDSSENRWISLAKASCSRSTSSDAEKWPNDLRDSGASLRSDFRLSFKHSTSWHVRTLANGFRSHAKSEWRKVFYQAGDL